MLLIDKLDVYASQLNEWFLTGIKPTFDIYQIKLELIGLKLNTKLSIKDLKNVSSLLDRIELLIKIGL
jgi:hypothetical protein